MPFSQNKIKLEVGKFLVTVLFNNNNIFNINNSIYREPMYLQGKCWFKRRNNERFFRNHVPRTGSSDFLQMSVYFWIPQVVLQSLRTIFSFLSIFFHVSNQKTGRQHLGLICPFCKLYIMYWKCEMCSRCEISHKIWFSEPSSIMAVADSR